jgi:cell division protein FtsW (lipid II flippase)
MKKFLFIIIFLIILSTPVFAQNYNATFSGVYGYILTPTAIPCPPKTFIIGFSYVFTPGTLPLALTFSFIKDWEIGIAYELNLSGSGAINPLQLSTKIQFTKDASFGVIIDGFLGSQGYTTIEPYVAIHSGSIFGKGVMDVTIGKDFYIGAGQNDLINLYIGTKIPLIGDQFLLLAEFLNNPHRMGYIGYYGDGRGIFNMGFLLNLTPFLSIHFMTFDILDGFDFIMCFGVDLKLGI